MSITLPNEMASRSVTIDQVRARLAAEHAKAKWATALFSQGHVDSEESTFLCDGRGWLIITLRAVPEHLMVGSPSLYKAHKKSASV